MRDMPIDFNRKTGKHEQQCDAADCRRLVPPLPLSDRVALGSGLTSLGLSFFYKIGKIKYLCPKTIGRFKCGCV